MSDAKPAIQPIVQQIHLSAGVAGPAELSFDVRCFLVPTDAGFILVDTGMAGSTSGIDSALERSGADWSDVSDVILTHSQPDHVGGLGEVAQKLSGASLWIGSGDLASVSSPAPLRAVTDGDRIRGVLVIHTPGHTKAHIALLNEDDGVLFVGDAVGSMDGVMVRPPAPFTADASEAEGSLRKLSTLTPRRMLFSHGAEVPDAMTQLHGLLNHNVEELRGRPATR